VTTVQRWVSAGPGAPLVWSDGASDAPALAPDDLLVAVEAAVVGAPEALVLSQGRPFAPGGAAVGRVVATGAAAAHRLDERVLVGPVRACFECDVCRRGHPTVCPRRLTLGIDADGALASHVVTRARATTGLVGLLAKVAPGPEAALLAREAPLAYWMLVRAGVAPGDVTIWIGGGPIAALGLALARAKGVSGFAPLADELALTPDAGAAALRARLAAAGANLPPRIFEVSAAADGRARAAALAGPGTTLVLLAAAAAGASEHVPIPAALLDDDVTIVGVAGAHPDLVPELCALVARGELDLGEAVPGGMIVWPWHEVPAILLGLRAGHRAGQAPAIVARG
jgi:threonine dehydrogenase-like Zn-dependent dehydrogenase